MKNIIKDPKYGYLRLEPIPSNEEVVEFYAKEFYDANASYFNNSSLEVQQEQSDFFNTRWNDVYSNCSKKFNGEIKDKTVFDIGFGFAQALLFFKEKGLDVSGLEPSIDGYNYALSKGINAFHTGIENFDCVGENKFDIVLLMNVLEHLREPATTLLNIKNQLLNDNGILVIDVPNDFNTFQEVANLEYDLDQWWVVAPNHINYFSPDSLKSLLNDCGYDVFEYESAFPLDMFLLFGDQYVGNPEIGKECHNKRVNFERLMRKYNKEKELKALYKSFADLNLGRCITIYASPKAKK
jgi:SAM-dependent methyltransferase